MIVMVRFLYCTLTMIQVEHILEKGSGRLNEDSLVMGENIFGVFDGATSLITTPEPDKSRSDKAQSPAKETGGYLAATTAKNVFSKNHYPLDNLGRTANTAILEKMKAHGVNLNRPEQIWSTSAAVVRIKNNELEWFQTGDSYILLIHEDGSHKVLVDQDDHDFETLTLLKTQENKTLSNPILNRQILKVRSNMNKTYGVLNGDPRAKEFFVSGITSLKGVSSVLLFTDGLNIPSPAPERQKDFTDLARTFQNLGLNRLHGQIRKMESKDPDRKQFPRFKCHDDIAAIAIHLK